MIYKNYHTHTVRCHHAIGSDRDYIEAAIKAGLKTLGFADHTPQFFKGNYICDWRMSVEELGEYVMSLSDLKEEYKGRIEILIGLEVEYYPEIFDRLMDLIKVQNIEYLLLSHHCYKNEYDVIYPENHPLAGRSVHAFHRGLPPELITDYVNREIAGMEKGVFSYIAHPDGIRFEGDMALYRKEMSRLCEAALKHKLPLELNLLGIQENRHYPREEFWQIASKVGNTAIIGYDAHAPQRFTNYPWAIEKAEEMLKKYKIPRTEEISFPLKG